MPDEATSAMGPSGEPGNANPPKADESRGLGGAGTEGKPGEPAGGVEPQIPEIAVPSDNQIEQVVNDIEQMPPENDSPAAGKKRGRQAAIDEAIEAEEKLEQD